MARFIVSNQLFRNFPNLNIGVVIAKGLKNSLETLDVTQKLRKKEAEIRKKYTEASLAEEARIKKWDDAYSSFDAKKYRASHITMLTRVLQGSAAANVSSLVDSCSMVALAHMLPVGGDDINNIEGDIILTYTAGNDDFIPLGKKESEKTKEGEIVYRDSKDILSRRWNNRKCEKTKFTTGTRNAILYCESLTGEELARDAAEEMRKLAKSVLGADAEVFIINKVHNCLDIDKLELSKCETSDVNVKSAAEKPKEEDNRLIAERKRKLNELKSMGVNPYPYLYDRKDHAAELIGKYKNLKAEEHTKDKAGVAGRIMLMRPMGKAAFMHIQDQSGRIQLYFKEDILGKENYSLLRKLDLGDIIGAKGIIFKTKTGETTIEVTGFEILCKAIRPLPEKYHGLVDVEARYRQRYLDLIMNPEVMNVFMLRNRIIKEIRNFLDSREFVEVETPILQPIYGGAAAKPFVTHHNALDMKLYMKVSPELYLKRLIVGGFEKVYDMNKNFRNEGIDHSHNPEFTMLEWYEAYGDYNKVMADIEMMIKQVAEKTVGTLKINFRGKTIDLSRKFERLSMKEALKKYANVDVDRYDDKRIRELISTYNLEYHGDLSRGTIITVLFEELVEVKLINPTFITDYPKEVSPLTKVKRDDNTVTERFELFINGQEFANGYSELNDPIDQRERLEQQEKNRVIDDEAYPMDSDFVTAIEHGMPPTCGVGMGVDRLVMLLTGSDSIRDVILFPTMKPNE